MSRRNKSKVRRSLKCLRALTQQPPPPICQGQSRRPTPANPPAPASSQAKANIPSDSTELCKSRFRETYWESRVSASRRRRSKRGSCWELCTGWVCILYFRQKWLKKTLCAGWILKWGSLSAVIWHAVTKKTFHRDFKTQRSPGWKFLACIFFKLPQVQQHKQK